MATDGYGTERRRPNGNGAGNDEKSKQAALETTGDI